MDLVQINNGQAVTSSLQVAEYFGKKHQHVMEKVRALLAEIPSDWGVSNFRGWRIAEIVNLAERMGGSLRAESREGEGAGVHERGTAGLYPCADEKAKSAKAAKTPYRREKQALLR